jgi:7,8-dihydropterin-6-yl-methyl-4-(beta-D-ribofuranosyl)aminobenzene 5'-phosphate synthase
MLFFLPACERPPKEADVPVPKKVETCRLADLKFTIVYDNNEGSEGLNASWGFACLIEGLEQKVLMDTGGDPKHLAHNMEKLGIDPESLDLVFMTHTHWDHSEGMKYLKEAASDFSVCVLESFPEEYKKQVSSSGGELIEVRNPTHVTDVLLSTGGMGFKIVEQSVVIPTDRGTVVVIGCGHAGLEKVVKRAKRMTKQEVFAVIGGYHLIDYDERTINKSIDGMREAGVKYYAPGHCSGDNARRLFREAFGEHYFDCAVGFTLDADDFKE